MVIVLTNSLKLFLHSLWCQRLCKQTVGVSSQVVLIFSVVSTVVNKQSASVLKLFLHSLSCTQQYFILAFYSWWQYTRNCCCIYAHSHLRLWSGSRQCFRSCSLLSLVLVFSKQLSSSSQTVRVGAQQLQVHLFYSREQSVCVLTFSVGCAILILIHYINGGFNSRGFHQLCCCRTHWSGIHRGKRLWSR